MLYYGMSGGPNQSNCHPSPKEKEEEMTEQEIQEALQYVDDNYITSAPLIVLAAALRAEREKVKVLDGVIAHWVGRTYALEDAIIMLRGENDRTRK